MPQPRSSNLADRWIGVISVAVGLIVLLLIGVALLIPRPAQPHRPGPCRKCHPRDFELHPKNHLVKDWRASAHFAAKKRSPASCGRCHVEKKFCARCHGMLMPHPRSWAKAHRTIGRRKPASCRPCHKGPNFCQECHHGVTNPSTAWWIRNHQFRVWEQGGMKRCMMCHQQSMCQFCHVRGIHRYER